MFFLLLKPLINHVFSPKNRHEISNNRDILTTIDNHEVQTMRSTVYKVFCIRQHFGKTCFHSWNFIGHGWTTIELLPSELGLIETAIPKIHQQTARISFCICRFLFTDKSTEIFCHSIIFLKIVFINIPNINWELNLVRTISTHINHNTKMKFLWSPAHNKVQTHSVL